MLKFMTLEKDNYLQVYLDGELDIEGTEIIKEELIPMLLKVKAVDVSLEKVPLIDSTGIGLLIDLVKTLRENQSEITISNVSEDIFEIFEIIQLPEILGEKVFV
ncbi:STAS domain-containing protein [Bacillus sp. Marseille-P3661]|uniref:STAS domain-containing protein n=1 Tax=Bacillus sp. Marseille-P3661 TaxID=1936234 RepID=UPI000C82F965|nr:STAS domain-containing protein [Bacillus sp. Marseille-P3661]